MMRSILVVVLSAFALGLLLSSLSLIMIILQVKLEDFSAFIATIGWSVGIGMVILSNGLLTILKNPVVAG